MNICFLVPWITQTRGGTENVGHMMASAMAARGHEVHVVTCDPDRGAPSWPLPDSVTLHHVVPTRDEALEREMETIIATLAPDLLVGLHMNRTFALYVRVAHRLGVPIVLSEHIDPRFPQQIGSFAKQERWTTFQGAARIHLLVEAFRETLPAHLAQRIHVIPNTVPPARQSAEPGAGAERKRLVTVARLVARKNLPQLMTAFARLAPDHPDWDLWIVGDGSERPALEQAAREAGLARRVVFTGMLEDVYAELEQAHLFVLPSLHEGFPLSSLEAMAHGLPVVGFAACNGINVQVEHGKTGLLVEDFSDKETGLVGALDRLMDQPDLRVRMGAAGLARYRKMFGPDLIADRWEALFAEAIASAPAPELQTAPLPELPDLPRVSVIIPVHGVEAYIEECLRSVQTQTLREIEIITVNDASPDASQEIIDRLAARDPRIRPIVLRQNVGQGFARNKGLDEARGEYVWFLDSDDFLASPDHLEQVVACAEADGAQMVRGRKAYEQVEDARGKILRRNPDPSERFFTAPFHARTVVNEPRILRSRHFYNWLYRRDFLIGHDIRFLTPQWEERPFLLRALLSADRISGTTSEAFVYRVRDLSTARRSKSLRDCSNLLSNFEQIVDLLREFKACDPDSPLGHVAGYVIGQALHILFHGFAYETVCLSKKDGARQDFLDRVSDTLDRAGLNYDGLVFEAPQISTERLGGQAYRLLFEALRSRRADLVDVAVNQESLPQEEVMALLRETPADARAADLQIAIGLYARNDQITTANIMTPVADKPRLIIHVGQTKTGSTYFQHVLDLNRAALLRAGIYVPDKGLYWQSSRPAKQAGHAGFAAEAIDGTDLLRTHVEAALALGAGKIHTVILSSEAFFLERRSVLLAEHFEGYPVEMIGYFRRQDDWTNSQYAEFVAGGALGRVTQSFEAWLASPLTRERLDYHSYCHLWAAAIGRENVHARPYDTATGAARDVVGDAFETLGLELPGDMVWPKAHQRNDFTYTAAHIDLFREINGYVWPDGQSYLDYCATVADHMSLLAPEGGQGARIITQAQRRRVMSRLAPVNAAFAAQFCPEVAELWETPALTADADVPDPTLSRAEMRAIFEPLQGFPVMRKLPPVQPPQPPLRPLRSVEEMQALTGIFIEATEVPDAAPAGTDLLVDVILHNLSRRQLPLEIKAGLPLNLSYWLLDETGARLDGLTMRTGLTEPVDRMLRARLRVMLPIEPGSYSLRVALVSEGVRWILGHRHWPITVT
jgi:capsular polysaccharide export protein